MPSSRSRSTGSATRSAAVWISEYVARLATYVDEKMRAAADSTPTGDSLRLAVLTALNVADELFRCRDGTRRATASWPSAPASWNACSTASFMA